MRKHFIGATVTASLLTLALMSAPHRASADTNGICLLDATAQIPVAANASTAGYPIFPVCTPDRELHVVTLPDPSSPPQNVNVLSLPSSAPINGSVNVNNFPTPLPYPTPPAIYPISAPSPVPVTGSVNVGNFPSPAAYPTPIPFPSVQTVTGSVNIGNFPTVQIVSVPSPIAISNFPTPVPVQPISIATTLPVVQPAAKYTILSAAGTTSISGAKTFLGTANISTSAQITAVTCYDNASAASGPIVISTVLGLTPPWFPSGGIALTNGLTCNVPVALLGNGIAVYTRTF